MGYEKEMWVDSRLVRPSIGLGFIEAMVGGSHWWFEGKISQVLFCPNLPIGGNRVAWKQGTAAAHTPEGLAGSSASPNPSNRGPHAHRFSAVSCRGQTVAPPATRAASFALGQGLITCAST